MLLFWGWGALDARDSAGAIVVLWDEDLGIIGPEVDAFSMSCHFRCNDDGSVWVFFFLVSMGLLASFWGLWNELWSIGGDCC